MRLIHTSQFSAFIVSFLSVIALFLFCLQNKTRRYLRSFFGCLFVFVFVFSFVSCSRPFSMYLDSYLAWRFQGIKQKKRCYSLLSVKMTFFVLFCWASEPSMNFSINQNWCIFLWNHTLWFQMEVLHRARSNLKSLFRFKTKLGSFYFSCYSKFAPGFFLFLTNLKGTCVDSWSHK